MKNLKINNKGQSTIEFILTFTAAVGFIFLFLKMALNYTNGYMVHHATFMASRVYLVHDDQTAQDPAGGDEPAFKAAKIVFKKYMPDILMPGVSIELKANDPNSTSGSGFTVFTGLFANFTQAFSMGMIGGKTQMDFRSESFLGREPTRAETVSQTCKAISFLVGAGCDTQATLDDNGG